MFMFFDCETEKNGGKEEKHMEETELQVLETE
jgi:hypothetical protein